MLPKEILSDKQSNTTPFKWSCRPACVVWGRWYVKVDFYNRIFKGKKGNQNKVIFNHIMETYNNKKNDFHLQG